MSRLFVLEWVLEPEKYPELGSSKRKSGILGGFQGIVERLYTCSRTLVLDIAL